ncbi:MAG: hypothetical protein D6E12_01900 [Desulfovibrio sp.]|nr:MAG: hypothetical protein D6E12_01900 [Desulfovibrio sp.]
MPAPSPLSVLLAQIRTVLYSAGRHIMSQAQPLIEQAYTLLDKEDPGCPQTALHDSDLAFSVARMLELTTDKAFISFGLGVLINLGPMGEILCVSFLRRTELPKQTTFAIVARMPRHKLLQLVNRILANPKDTPDWLQDWAFSLIQETIKDDPEDVLLFLETLDQRGLPLSYPMQRELMRSRFGVWLNQLLRLDLSSEQLGYMARTSSILHSFGLTRSLLHLADKAGTDNLPKLLEIVGHGARQGDTATAKTLAKYLKHTQQEVRAAAITALTNLNAPNLAKALAYVHTNSPSLHPLLLSLLARVSQPVFTAFVKLTPSTELPQLLQQLTGHISWVDPHPLFSLLEAVEHDSALQAKVGQHVIDSLKRWIMGRQPIAHGPRFRLDASVYGHGHDESEQDSGFLAQMKAAQEAELTRRKPERTKDPFPRSSAKDFTVSDISRDKLHLPGESLSSTTFTKVSFTNSDFSSLQGQELTFNQCRFTHVTFDGAVFDNVRFNNCVLVGCRFAGAGFFNVDFIRCTLRHCHFLGSTGKYLSITTSTLNDCSWSGSRLTQWHVESSQVTACHFSHTALFSCTLRGVQLRDCFMDHLHAQKCSIHSCETVSTSLPNARLLHLDSDSALFLHQHFYHDTTFPLSAESGSRTSTAPPELGSAEGAALMRVILDRYYFFRDVSLRRLRYLASNGRRLDWSTCMLGQGKDAFFTILPLLIESSDTELMGPPACSIHGYTPGHEALDHIRSMFSMDSDSLLHKHEDQAAISIDAVCTIGSTGTIAQAQSSDIDLWVCFDNEDMVPGMIPALEDKLQRIEAWADAELGLEVHFFPMDRQSIEENKFGFSDDESAGSTQALLLKEEFYRTGMIVAGKLPAWWLMPPRLSDAGYADYMDRLSQSPLLDQDQRVDFGNLQAIPKEEFFGASLWQIVKAIKSPFKSIMKFALLDKYLAGQSVDMLLSNKIKEQIFRGEQDMWEIDPYAVLFREVFDHYRTEKREDAQRLMRLSFLQKTGLHVAAQSSGRFFEMQGYSFMEYFFPYSESDIAAHVEPRPGEDSPNSLAPSTFQDFVGLGEHVAQFLLATYATVQRKLKDSDKDILITTEDMTRLGRRIFAYLQPKPHKVMPLPFLYTQGKTLAGLEFNSSGVAGAKPVWTVKGAVAGSGGKPRDMEDITNDTLLERLLLWCAVNGLHKLGGHVQAGPSLVFPVSLMDILDLLTVLVELFPPALVLNPDLGENLKPERITRALISVNLLAPREQKRFTSAVCLYATNWGEVYCRPADPDLTLLAKSPRDFLQANATAPLTSETLIQAHIPRKAVCPRPKII